MFAGIGGWVGACISWQRIPSFTVQVNRRVQPAGQKTRGVSEGADGSQALASSITDSLSSCHSTAKNNRLAEKSFLSRRAASCLWPGPRERGVQVTSEQELRESLRCQQHQSLTLQPALPESTMLLLPWTLRDGICQIHGDSHKLTGCGVWVLTRILAFLPSSLGATAVCTSPV